MADHTIDVRVDPKLTVMVDLAKRALEDADRARASLSALFGAIGECLELVEGVSEGADPGPTDLASSPAVGADDLSVIP